MGELISACSEISYNLRASYTWADMCENSDSIGKKTRKLDCDLSTDEFSHTLVNMCHVEKL